MNAQTTPLIDVQHVSKYFGSVIALKDISMSVRAGEVMCLLGDNGAGKSTLIKILSGVHQPSEGRYLFGGKEAHFSSPRDALSVGIATVFQDLAMIPLMGISRNFFLGSEPTKGWGPFSRFNVKFADQVTREELAKMGIQVRETTQPVGTLSGGERQSVAIARAVYFGAKVLILDEPTAALGVKEAGVVLRYIAQARARNLGVIFITHNPHHAYPIGDYFTILNRGSSYGTFAKSEISREELTAMMAGGEALEELSHELAEFARTDEKAAAALAGAAQDLKAEAAALQVEQLPTRFTEAEHQYAEPLPPAPLDGDA
jgi:simple sugar transport system ATP-binding protein